jgi:hypothetical protein
VGDLVCALTVNFPGVTIVSGEVKDAGGRSMVSCGAKTDSVVFTVLRGENYQVVLRVGYNYYTYTGVILFDLLLERRKHETSGKAVFQCENGPSP